MLGHFLKEEKESNIRYPYIAARVRELTKTINLLKGNERGKKQAQSFVEK